MIFILAVRDAELERFRQGGIALDPETVCTVAPSVADAHQDQGLGSRLMLHLINIARRLGRRLMVLFDGVYATNQRAIHFYEKHGFHTVGAFARVDGRISYNILLEF
jgi:GNAT superfamily N-acetyltransferase